MSRPWVTVWPPQGEMQDHPTGSHSASGGQASPAAGWAGRGMHQQMLAQPRQQLHLAACPLGHPNHGNPHPRPRGTPQPVCHQGFSCPFPFSLPEGVWVRPDLAEHDQQLCQRRDTRGFRSCAAARVCLEQAGGRLVNHTLPPSPCRNAAPSEVPGASAGSSARTPQGECTPPGEAQLDTVKYCPG